LQTLITSDGSDKDKLNHKLENNHRQMNGRAKMSRIDPIRFSEPPAPPPQQPLPEKPDVARRAAQEPPAGGLKRSDTEKPLKESPTSSPVSKESSQILSLIEALSTTKKELEAQNSRVKELEELLRQERSARENAGERKQEADNLSAEPAPEQLEAAETDVLEVEEITKTLDSSTSDPAEVAEPKSVEDPVLDAQTQKLQQQLDHMVTELAEMKHQVETFKQRAEKAEGETIEVRKSLAEMIETIRQEREQAAKAKESLADAEAEAEAIVTNTRGIGKSDEKATLANHKVDPHKIKELENAVTSLTQQRKPNMLENSGPYASMVGVVLLGIGLMAYLNGWQKIER
jgi:DNA repair exonuclease SbcCD ATPase subunit